MVRIFVREAAVDASFSLGRDVKKRLIKVMRLQKGDPLEVFSRSSKWYCRLAEILSDGVRLEIISELPAPARPKIELILAQSMIKNERFEWLIQKATELGVSAIFPVISRRSIVRPSSIDQKLQRWNDIAEHAAGQSENSYPAIIHPPQNLQTFLQQPPEGFRILLHEREDSLSLRQALEGKKTMNRITFIVGPEGGWTFEESEQITATGFLKVHLGSRILRAETAGLTLAAILQYLHGDFSE